MMFCDDHRPEEPSNEDEEVDDLSFDADGWLAESSEAPALGPRTARP